MRELSASFPNMRLSSVRISTILVVLVFVLGTIWFTFPQINAMDSVPRHNDPMFSTWRLAWVAHQLGNDPIHLLNANVIYPTHRALLYSDAFPLLGLFATPLIWAGLPPIVAYNVLILASFLFSGLAAFVFIRHLTGSTIGAVIGGVIFVFAPMRFGHYMHQELLWTGWIPLSLWALHRTIETSKWRYALLTGACFVAQTYSSIYYAIMLATFIGIVAALLVLMRVLDLRSVAFRRLVVAAVMSGVLIAPWVYLYRQSEKMVGLREQWEIEQYSAQPKSYFAAPPYNVMWGWTSTNVSPRAVDETQLFPGIAAVVLAVIGLAWPPTSRVKIAYAVAMVLAFDLSLGFNGITFPLLFHLVPIFRGLRALARFSVLVQLMLALFAAFGFARLLERALPRRALAVLLVVGVSGVLVAEYTNRSLPLVRAATRPSTFSQFLRKQPPSTVVLELPVPKAAALPGLDPHYVFESTFHWRPLVNGYTAFVPPHYVDFLLAMERFPDQSAAAALRDSGAQLVVVHPQWLFTEENHRAYDWLKQQPDFKYEGAFTDHAGSVEVFRRVRVAPPAPTAGAGAGVPAVPPDAARRSAANSRGDSSR
jgi:hypothetical protein